MTKLIKQIKADSIAALKAGDNTKKNSLRLIIGNVERNKTAFQIMSADYATDEQVQETINKMLKNIAEEAESRMRAGMTTTPQEVEEALLLTYMPQQATAEEIDAAIDEAFKAVQNGECKAPMAYLSKKLNGKADMKKVNKRVCERIQEATAKTAAKLTNEHTQTQKK